FMALMALSTTLLSAIDLTKLKPSVWKARKLNEAALELYGQKKFATLQKSEAIVIEAEKAIVRDAQQIPIRFKTEIEAQSVALFQTGNDQSLVAVFNIEEGMIIDYELNIRMDRKGTFFVVVEGVDNRLYYKRHFIDVSSFRCVA
ncbi:MAG TPA: hypothetical protein ENK82_07825, partial [Campylobacterales bacterium]|nr:hypothetical protein [Campylobacterales bacterium]